MYFFVGPCLRGPAGPHGLWSPADQKLGYTEFGYPSGVARHLAGCVQKLLINCNNRIKLDQQARLKNDGMPLKYAGKKPLFTGFLNAIDPGTHLHKLRNSNQTLSAPSPPQTCSQHHMTIFDEDDEEWVDEDGAHDR